MEGGLLERMEANGSGVLAEARVLRVHMEEKKVNGWYPWEERGGNGRSGEGSAEIVTRVQGITPLSKRRNQVFPGRMDYSLAALKLLCGQLKNASETPSQNAMTLGGVLFQRAWLQGVLVSAPDDGDLLLDDGTGVLCLSLSRDFRLQEWKIGMYVMVVGLYVIDAGEPSKLKVHKMVDLSPFPDREAAWYLEVIEAFKLFYEALIEG